MENNYIVQMNINVSCFKPASVLSQYRACLEIQGSRVQTRRRSMNFFQNVKILSTSPPGGTLLGVPSLRF